MIVDDEPLEREVLTMIIKRANLGISQLFEATNGVEAMNIAKQNRMDVILMDIKMPIMDGLVADGNDQKRCSGMPNYFPNGVR